MHGKNSAVTGAITLGLGEGSYFMSMQHYKNEIKKKLGFAAYPGTLNLRSAKAVKFDNKKAVRISGFNSGKNKFGGAACYRARLKNVEGAIIVPDLTRHEGNIIEFIAPVHIKSKLKLRDGEKIEIELVQ